MACRSSRRRWASGSAFTVGAPCRPERVRRRARSRGRCPGRTPRVSTPSSAAQVGGHVVEPGSFGRPVGGVEQGRAAGGEVLAGRVVPQVGGEVRVDPGGGRVARNASPDAAADREGTNHTPGIARRREPPRRWPGSTAAACRVSSASVSGRGQLADPADARARRPRAGEPGAGRSQRAQLGQAEPGGERVGDARGGHVGVGVRDVQRHAGPDQLVDDPALVGGRARPTRPRAAAADGARRSGRRRRRAPRRPSRAPVDHAEHPADRRGRARRAPGRPGPTPRPRPADSAGPARRPRRRRWAVDAVVLTAGQLTGADTSRGDARHGRLDAARLRRPDAQRRGPRRAGRPAPPATGTRAGAARPCPAGAGGTTSSPKSTVTPQSRSRARLGLERRVRGHRRVRERHRHDRHALALPLDQQARGRACR